ncbi:mechanosensitive ion channel family protein [Demequina sp. B12]|uniref:mechanosensitive ion channel family protein n=1 Tax=Demequina sp. B12 TaxID=2992757 RepID=UPI00237ACCA2|nr:mechanosensitive ion channel family protein [Demequina sp. B12]MDE0573525.1 mechanosensitive ion channel family protein [Demequina sp. B12]
MFALLSSKIPLAGSASADPSATPTTEPSLPGVPDAGDIGEWLGDVESRAGGLGAVVLIALLVWVIFHYVIKWFVHGIEKGTPISDPKTLAALKKAKIRLPQQDDMDARLEAERRRQRAHTLKRVLDSALAVVVVIMLVMAVLAVLGLPVGPMLASAGIVGVALGFGAQSLVKDILAGVFMLIEDQYGVGDVVDLGAAAGSVEEVGLRCTRLRALDGTVWYVPNGEITRVGNMTRLWSRVMIEVRFAYDTDVEAAKDAMIDAVKSAAVESDDVKNNLLGEPEVAGIESLEYNAIMLRLMCQVNPAMQWDVQREVRREMRRIFAERNIRLAVPGDAIIVDEKPAKRAPRINDVRRPHDEQPADDEGRPLPPASHDLDGDGESD